MLTLPSPEPFWLDLMPGVRVKVRPIDTPAYLEAQQASREVIRSAPKGESLSAETLAGSQAAFTVALVRRGLVEWEGVGDAEGKPIPVEPEAVDRLLAFYPAFAAFEDKYVGPLLDRIAEKNV